MPYNVQWLFKKRSKHATRNCPKIGEFGVRYVIEGSIRKSSNKVRINAQLIDAITGRHLWADRYDRDWKDIFALQDEITQKIVLTLNVEVTEAEPEVPIIIWGATMRHLKS
jgi:TolB-like protein